MSYESIIRKYGRAASESKMLASAALVDTVLAGLETDYPDEYWKFMRKQHELWCGPHFDEQYAKWQVSRMYHMEGGNKVCGQHWTMEDAARIHAANKSRLGADTTVCDVYVAINAQWHDYCVLMKQLYPSEYESAIVKMAIAFFFEDNDFPDGGKVWWYFASMAQKR